MARCWGLEDDFFSKASFGGPHENPMNAAIGCSRRMDRVEPWEGVACVIEEPFCAAEPFGAVIGDDGWKNAENAKPRDWLSSKELDTTGALGTTGVA